MRHRLARGVVALVSGAALVGCGPGDSAPEAPPPPTGAAGVASPGSAAPAPPAPRTAPVRARTPRQVAAQIAAVERVIHAPASSAAQVGEAARQQQVSYRVLGDRPGWDRRVYPLLPTWVRPIARDNVASRREFRSMHGELSRTVPAWRIVQPRPAVELLRHYRAAERRFGVDWEFLAAINLVETGMGRIRGTSSAGAQGPMQFMPATWSAYGRGDIDDPRDAIMAAGRYLRAMGYRSGDRAAVDAALYRYNNHVAYVRGVRLIAERMQARPRSYRAYHAWRIYYLTVRGDVLLPVGYDEREPVPVDRYLRRSGG